jgi:hypothetical protein
MKNDDLFRGLEPPPPPPGLREAALRAGRMAMVQTPAPDVWELLFRSGFVRGAWVLSVIALAVAHAFVPDRAGGPYPAPSARLEPEIAGLAHAHASGFDDPAAALRASGLEGESL